MSPSHSVGLERFTTSKIHRFGTGYVTIPRGGLRTQGVSLDAGGGGSCVMSPSHTVGLEQTSSTIQTIQAARNVSIPPSGLGTQTTRQGLLLERMGVSIPRSGLGTVRF